MPNPHAKPNETMPSENARGGHVNHTPAAVGITTNEDPWSEPPPEIKLPQNETRYRLNHLPNEPPLWEMTMQRAKEHPPDETWDREHTMRGPRDPRRTTPTSAGMVKQNDNPLNEPAQLPPGNDDGTRQNNMCQTKHTNDDRPDQTQESTTHPPSGCVVILSNESKPRCKPQMNPTPASAGILLNLHPPTKKREIWDLRESQTCSRPYGLIGDNIFHL
ncbi:hypothetical protein BS47DRAFT_1369306 [Hydnum rufescens UP504]|uniref:Uncharacterized protein n=1 Tax=Hydnum rufescens UP504 TaxID=1448309 RepID=A0A9P6AD81_9AGAM|nr:hypothetical protein BS47DRAFT_1369306 [Hydnum rufescens UP504]